MAIPELEELAPSPEDILIHALSQTLDGPADKLTARLDLTLRQGDGEAETLQEKTVIVKANPHAMNVGLSTLALANGGSFHEVGPGQKGGLARSVRQLRPKGT